MSTQVIEYHATILGVPVSVNDISTFGRRDLAIQDVVQPHGLVAKQYVLVCTRGWSIGKNNDLPKSCTACSSLKTLIELCELTLIREGGKEAKVWFHTEDLG